MGLATKRLKETLTFEQIDDSPMGGYVCDPKPKMFHGDERALGAQIVIGASQDSIHWYWAHTLHKLVRGEHLARKQTMQIACVEGQMASQMSCDW